MAKLTIDGVPITLDQKRYEGQLATEFAKAGLVAPVITWEAPDGPQVRPKVTITETGPDEKPVAVTAAIRATWCGFHIMEPAPA